MVMNNFKMLINVNVSVNYRFELFGIKCLVYSRILKICICYGVFNFMIYLV